MRYTNDKMVNFQGHELYCTYHTLFLGPFFLGSFLSYILLRASNNKTKWTFCMCFNYFRVVKLYQTSVLLADLDNLTVFRNGGKESLFFKTLLLSN